MTDQREQLEKLILQKYAEMETLSMVIGDDVCDLMSGIVEQVLNSPIEESDLRRDSMSISMMHYLMRVYIMGMERGRSENVNSVFS